MKKILVGAIIGVVAIVILIFLANINVSIQRGINYRVETIKMPLFLKLLDFVDRHYNYKYLVNTIVRDIKSDELRAIRLFEWTYRNIKSNPPELPVVDDHVWFIIVRGYGASDQFSDVFTTLCNYAGLKAFFGLAANKEETQRMPLSFVRIDKDWRVFDPYRGVYFRNNQGRLASISELRAGQWSEVNLGIKSDIDYFPYFSNLPDIKEIGLQRANIQSPLNRLLFAIDRFHK